MSTDSLPAFLPATQTVATPRPAIRPRTLRAVRADRHGDYDRVVFELAGDTLPGYHVGYAEPPVVACGSGREVSLAGAAVLTVRLDPAQAHDEAGRPTVTERRRAPALPALKEMAITCDFEGQVEWALGLAARVPFRVLTLEGPARVVVDLQHQP